MYTLNIVHVAPIADSELECRSFDDIQFMLLAAQNENGERIDFCITETVNGKPDCICNKYNQWKIENDNGQTTKDNDEMAIVEYSV